MAKSAAWRAWLASALIHGALVLLLSAFLPPRVGRPADAQLITVATWDVSSSVLVSLEPVEEIPSERIPSSALQVAFPPEPLKQPLLAVPEPVASRPVGLEEVPLFPEPPVREEALAAELDTRRIPEPLVALDDPLSTPELPHEASGSAPEGPALAEPVAGGPGGGNSGSLASPGGGGEGVGVIGLGGDAGDGTGGGTGTGWGAGGGDGLGRGGTGAGKGTGNGTTASGSGQGRGRTRAARPREELKPTYPEDQRRAGREATVILLVHLDESGRAQTIEVVTPNVAAEFLRSALSAAKAVRYEPALVDGKPAASLLRVRVEYRLE